MVDSGLSNSNFYESDSSYEDLGDMDKDMNLIF